MKITALLNDDQGNPPPLHWVPGRIKMVAHARAALFVQQVALLPFGNRVGGPGPPHWIEAAVAQFPAVQMGRSDFIVP